MVRDTEAEAKRYFEWYVDECGDLEGAQVLANKIIGGGVQSLPPEVLARQARALVAGWGAIPLVGTAEQVAEQLSRIQGMGFRRRPGLARLHRGDQPVQRRGPAAPSRRGTALRQGAGSGRIRRYSVSWRSRTDIRNDDPDRGKGGSDAVKSAVVDPYAERDARYRRGCDGADVAERPQQASGGADTSLAAPPLEGGLIRDVP